MATNNKWLDNASSIIIDGETYFSETFVLTNTGVLELANYLINPGITGFFSDPSNWLASLMYFPLDLYKSESNMYLQIGPNKTDIPTSDTSDVFAWFNLGEWYCSPHFNNFADYNGYTKIKIFLPFLGDVDVLPNDVMGKYVQFRFKVDIRTGLGVYYIGVSDVSLPQTENLPYVSVDDTNTRIIGVHSVQIGTQIPLGSSNAIEVYRNIIMGAVKTAGVVTAGYAMGAMGIVSPAYTTKNVTTARNMATGRQITMGTDVKTTTYDPSAYTKQRGVEGCFDTAINSLNSANMSVSVDKPNNAFVMANGPKSIKVVRYLPKLVDVDSNYNHLYGKPLGEVKTLSTVSGYTEISNIIFEGTNFGSCTEKEFAMIEQIFSSGVIL